MKGLTTGITMPRFKGLLFLAGKLIALAILATVGFYTWMYVYNPCDVDAVKDASIFLDIQLKHYDDVYDSAASGTPTSLTYPITVLQQILVDTQQIAVPACMATARAELINYMGTVIQAFQAYTAGGEDITVNNLIHRSNEHYYNFYSELDAVKECAPFCFP